MKSVQSDRYEIKFVCASHSLPTIFSWIREHAAKFRKQFPPRAVKSIYFDTPNFECLQENLSGVGDRVKTRLRWYGENFDLTDAVLEFKFKSRDRTGYKKSYPINKTAPLNATRPGKLPALFQAHVSDEDAFWLEKHTYPTLLVAYDRTYYASEMLPFRLTIDQRLKFYPQLSAFSFNPMRYYGMPDIAIVEAKFEPHVLTDASDILSSIPLRRTRFSKYVTGMSYIQE
jgi:hypothetical protein